MRNGKDQILILILILDAQKCVNGRNVDRIIGVVYPGCGWGRDSRVYVSASWERNHIISLAL